jgi:hypothetical protein
MAKRCLTDSEIAARIYQEEDDPPPIDEDEDVADDGKVPFISSLTRIYNSIFSIFYKRDLQIVMRTGSRPSRHRSFQGTENCFIL